MPPCFEGRQVKLRAVVFAAAIMADKSAPRERKCFEHDFFVRGAAHCGKDTELPWTISDDLPEQIEISREEIDLFQAYFGAILDELLARSR